MAADLLIRAAQEYGESLHPRAEGVHVSDIIACRRKGWYRLNGERVAPHSLETLLLFLMGQGHHSLLEAGQSEVTLSIDVDGIRVTGNVDHMEEDEHGEAYPAEFKTTRASYGKMKTPTDHYVEQAASYAAMKGVAHARIYVVFLLGDYKGAKLPKIRAWDLLFTDAEMGAWRREMARRTALIAGSELPSLDEHHDWECKYCPYNAALGGVCPGGEGTGYQWFGVQQDLNELLHDAA
jgi:hypothetical protein